MPLTVRYFAAARAAAGVTEETVAPPREGGPDATQPALSGYSLADLVDELAARHGPRLAKVLALASFLVDGAACRDREARLPADATVDVLPPFAGG